jgi:D-serine dehydratase
MTTNGGPALLLRNDGVANHSLRVRLIGTRSNRNGFGASVRVTAGGETQTQMLRSGSSYLSQSENVLTFGLGSRTQADTLEVRWPSGAVSRMSSVKSGGVVTVTER